MSIEVGDNRAGELSGLADAAMLLERFAKENLSAELADIERKLKTREARALIPLLSTLGVNSDLVRAALMLKSVAGQINVLIHAVGILISLPALLEAGEQVHSTSLGAGNTGRSFDLETDRRIAEFKFIHWRGGSETIRQNSLFKDFYMLAESTSGKRKYLYVLGLKYPLKFLNGKRALRSVLSRNNKLSEDFAQRYGDRFFTVQEYFAYRRNAVELVDLCPLVPSLTPVF